MAAPAPIGANEHLFRDGFESGSLAAWTSAETDGGDMRIGSDPKLSGGNSLEARINDSHTLYVAKTTPQAEGYYRARFSLDASKLALSAGEVVTIFEALDSTGSPLVKLELDGQQNGYAGLTLSAKQTDGSWRALDAVPVDGNASSVDLEWQASPSGVAQGLLSLWVNGMKSTFSGMDNAGQTVSGIRLGVVEPPSGGARGELFFDDFDSSRSSQLGTGGDQNGTPQIQTQNIAYTYDPLGRLTAADYADGNFYHYTYDAVGNRLSQSTPLGVVDSIYDAARVAHRNAHRPYNETERELSR
jgi:YD repeat-containing protein